MSKFKKTKKIALVLCALFAFAGILTAGKIYRFSMQSFPSPLPHSDIALVLGATTQGSEPLPVFRQRIEYAIDLYQRGLVSKILFTGAPGEPPQAEVALNFALKKGLPRESLLFEMKSNTTWENLLYSKELLKDSGTSLLIVSDPIHLWRAMQMAKELGLRATPAPVPDTRVQGFFSQSKFLLRETVAYWKYLFLKLFRR